MGHDARLIAPIYVKPFVKRQKNDSADAEAIAEAALRPTMRFVHIKSTNPFMEHAVSNVRATLGQRTEVINALRGHLAEFGHIAPKAVPISAVSWRQSRIEKAICQLSSESWPSCICNGSMSSQP